MRPNDTIMIARPVTAVERMSGWRWRVMRRASKEELSERGDFSNMGLIWKGYKILLSDNKKEVGKLVWMPHRGIRRRFKLKRTPLYISKEPDICELILKHLL